MPLAKKTVATLASLALALSLVPFGPAFAVPGDAAGEGGEPPAEAPEDPGAPEPLPPEDPADTPADTPADPQLEGGGAGEPSEEGTGGEEPAPVLEDGCYTIASALDPGLLLDVPWASEEGGAALSLHHGKGVLNQRFRIERGDDGFYSIRAVHSALALDVEGASEAPTARVIQWSYSGDANQRWAVEASGDGLFEITSKATGMALDVAWGEAVEGARVQVYPANGGANQRFVLTADESVPLSGGLYSLSPAHAPGMRVDVEGASASAGANVLLWGPNSGSNQKFQVESAGGSEFTLRSLCSGLYLAADGANVCQMPDPSSESARWRAVPGLGGISLVSASAGLCMDVDWAGSHDGCNVGLWERNGQANQAFRFSPVPVVDDGCYALVSAVGSRVLDVSWASRDNGAPVVAWPWHDAGNQKWNVSSNGDGTYRVENARSRRVLDTEGATGAPGSAAIQWGWNGGSNQRWEVLPTGDGWFYLRASNGLYLGVAGAGDYDGAPLQGLAGDASNAQRFRFMQTSYTPVPEAVKRPDGSWDWYNEGGYLDREGAVSRIISTARSLLGVPYVWLGVYPEDGGMDCASFTWYVYRQLGITIGFETYDQMNDGYRVGSLSEAKAGDLILMYYGGWPNYNPFLPEHVVLYAGDGMIYEEPDFGGHCQFVPLWSKGAGKMEIRRIIHD